MVDNNRVYETECGTFGTGHLLVKGSWGYREHSLIMATGDYPHAQKYSIAEVSNGFVEQHRWTWSKRSHVTSLTEISPPLNTSARATRLQTGLPFPIPMLLNSASAGMPGHDGAFPRATLPLAPLASRRNSKNTLALH